MADIRQNPTVLDAFDYGVSDYLPNLNANWVGHSAGGLSALLKYRTTSFGFVNCPSDPPDNQTRALCKWSPLVLDGDDQEIWAHEIGGSGSGKAWRLALTKSDVSAGLSGYSFTISVGTGGGAWFIRKYTADATGTVIGADPGGAPTSTPGWCLLRRVGNDLQAWHCPGSDPFGGTWSMIISCTDTTYMTGLIPTLWLADDAVQGHGYDYFGAGPALPFRPQFIRRPWRYEGKRLEVA